MVRTQRPLGARALNFFSSKNRSDVELARSQKKDHFQKVSKTKDLDMVKNFFVTRRCSLKIQKSHRITLFVCMNRYRTYNSVGFVPGGTFFGTLCPTQDETMSRGSRRPKALGSWTRMGPLWEAFHKIRLCRHALGRFCLVVAMHTGRAVKSNQVTMQCLHWVKVTYSYILTHTMVRLTLSQFVNGSIKMVDGRTPPP